ncbi:lipopolysaccharide kinase, partial [Pseudomonas quasicaspiana]|nr:lipopolysaccharide kinase [Pseudomonas quasicaspiana]
DLRALESRLQISRQQLPHLRTAPHRRPTQEWLKVLDPLLRRAPMWSSAQVRELLAAYLQAGLESPQVEDLYVRL